MYMYMYMLDTLVLPNLHQMHDYNDPPNSQSICRKRLVLLLDSALSKIAVDLLVFPFVKPIDKLS